MASSYPGGLDLFPTTRTDATTMATTHAADHNNANDAINKIEAELGINPSGSYTDIAARFAALGAGGGPALLVAASDSPTALKNRADYVCDGIADETEINTALAASLTVILAPGTFKTSAPITVTRDRASLLGCGFGTVIQPQSGFAAASGSRAYVLVDNGSGTAPVGYCTIADFFVQGQNIGTFGGSVFNGVQFRGYHGRIRNVFAQRCSNYGFLIQGYAGFSTFDTTIEFCTAEGCWASGFSTASRGEDLLLTSCKSLGNGDKVNNNTGIPAGVDSTAAHGFEFNDSSIQAVSCHPYGNGGGGFHFNTNTARHKIVGCKIEGNRHGIILRSGSGKHTIASNNFKGGAGTAISAHIYMDPAAASGVGFSQIIGNTFDALDDNNAAAAQYAIVFGSGQAQYNIVECNDFGPSFGTGHTDGNGAANQLIANNMGFVTENSGAQSVGAVTSVSVTHGLSFTPLKEEISLTPQGDTGAVRYWVSAVTSTTFTITYSAAATAHTMGWQAKRRQR